MASNDIELFAFEKLLENQDFTKIVQVNYQFTLSVNSVNDPLFVRQWSLSNQGTSIQGNGVDGADMQVDSAWTITTGGSNIKIAILDSGVDTLHEDLQANLLPGFDGFADDNMDTKGYPTPNFSSDSHGTACAGIAAAVGNNNIGVAGVAHTSKIVPVRIFYYQDFGGQIGVQPTTSTEALVNGTAFAWRVANADIFSISAGLDELAIFFMEVNTEIVDEEINEAYANGRNGNSVAMFFSAGNDDVDNVLWPAKLSNTIAVGASTMCDERKNPNDCSTESWGSTFGENLDFVAPGVLVASTDMTGFDGYSNGNYTNTFNGTSAACPNAAGVGALILSVKPNLHARDVKAILSLTADKVSGYDYSESLEHGTWNEEVGYGRVNAFEAVKMAINYESTVSISNPVNQQISFNVYPNPTSGKIHVSVKELEDFDLKVFNFSGQLILSRENIKRNYSFNLNSGIYFVNVNSNSNSIMKKVIVK